MVNIMTYNVRGMCDFKKRQKIFRFLREKCYDIIFCQEVHSTKKIEKLWKSQWGHKAFFAHDTSQSGGCMILIKKHIKVQILHVYKHITGRYLLLDCILQGERILLCNIYALNSDDVEYYNELLQKIDSIAVEHVIIGGDFNTVLNQCDKKGGVEKVGHPKMVKIIKHYMETKNIIDIWRIRNPDKKRFTWYKKKPYKMMERIDLFLVSAQLSSLINVTDIEPMFMSDHAIPLISLNLLTVDKGPGYWKFNSKFLRYDDYLEKISDMLSKNQEEYLQIKLRWEMMKMDTRGLSVKTSSRKKKAQKNKFDALETKLYQIMVDRDENTSIFTDHDNQIALITKEIEELVQENVYLAQEVNATNWFQLGEKNSSYFFGLKKVKLKRH